jgi:O-antigen ligase
MVSTHPLLGVGPDNFRLTYGDYANLSEFDTRVHSNNMYLEMLVGGGILGGLAFAWLCASACTAFVRALRAAGSQAAAAASGVAAAGAAIALHGMVDSFLGFTATYVLISITLGLAASSAAHRA